MKCPHCNSQMNNYETSSNDKSQVSFYRCSVCVAQHVSSTVVTAGQFEDFSSQNHAISGHTSHNTTTAML